jgi:IMP and pyridine-specific 5'-nucleotidase
MARLKEEDGLIDLIRSMMGPPAAPNSSSVEQAFEAAGALLEAHRLHESTGLVAAPGTPPSRLRVLCPSIGRVFVPLDLVGALREYDAGMHITKRRFVAPSFKEVRQVLNLSVLRAVAPTLRLVTLDADETIYSDGGTISPESAMIPLIMKLMRLGLHVSLVTAASYPGQPSKYEGRLAGLLSALAFALEAGAPDDILTRFHVLGGECNYLLRAAVSREADGMSPHVHLEEVPDDEWKDFRGVRWDHGEVARLLDAAQACMEATARDLQLDVTLIRKDRAVGVIAASPAASTRLSYEVLEEIALAVQHALREMGTPVPHCAFNGGRDCFVDIGNKALGITTLQGLLGIRPEECVHVGDRFTRTGNDLRARDVANTLWVGGPSETEYLLTHLIQDIRDHRSSTAAVGARASAAHGASSPSLGHHVHAHPHISLHPNASHAAAAPHAKPHVHAPDGLGAIDTHLGVRGPRRTFSPLSGASGVGAGVPAPSSSASGGPLPSPLAITAEGHEAGAPLSATASDGGASGSLSPSSSSSSSLARSSGGGYSHHGRAVGHGVGAGLSSVPVLYGMAPPRTSDEVKAAAQAQARSAWECAGGVLVAEVKGGTSSPRAGGGGEDEELSPPTSAAGAAASGAAPTSPGV